MNGIPHSTYDPLECTHEFAQSFRALKETFPTHLKIAEAPAEYIVRPIASGGLSNQKARAIRSLLDIIVAQFGVPTLKPLRAMSDKDAEDFLLSLPGVGKKTARFAHRTLPAVMNARYQPGAPRLA